MMRFPGELSSARPTGGSGCDYCGLPLPSSLWGTAAGEPDGPRYCCVGCRVAAAVTQEKGDAGAARWTLVKLGFAGFFAMNVMMFTMVLWSEDVATARRSTRGFRKLSQGFFATWRWRLRRGPVPAGRPLLENAAEGLKRRVLSTDLLLLSGVVASYLYSAISVLRGHGHIYFEVGCVIHPGDGGPLAGSGRPRASERITGCVGTPAADQVRTIRGGRELLIPREELKLGDGIRILPGDRIPSDGRIVKGLRPSMSNSLRVKAGRPISRLAPPFFGGTLNVEGAVIIELTAAASEGTVQRLIRGQLERLPERPLRGGWPNAFRPGSSSL